MTTSLQPLSHKATTGASVGTLLRHCSSPRVIPSSKLLVLSRLPKAASTLTSSRLGSSCYSTSCGRNGNTVGKGLRPTLPATMTVTSLLQPSSRRAFSDIAASKGKSEADLLVEEIEEHYFTTKDELEIATDSTDQSTIYAPSDRESARDALNHLISIYTLYTNPELSSPTTQQEQQEQPKPIRHGEDNEFGGSGSDASRLHVHGQGKLHGQGQGQQGQKVQEADVDEESAEAAGRFLDIETNYDPTKVPIEIRGEVRRRVERGVKEMEAAVEALEERASSE